MTDATTIARQHDPSLCPSWCDRQHLGFSLDELAAGAFHHDSPQWSLLRAHQPYADGDAYLYVTASQSVDKRGQAQPTVVELTDDNSPAVILTPDEATELAQALLAAAAKAQGR
jgi:type II secretory pathway predicted ATPase ExeA